MRKKKEVLLSSFLKEEVVFRHKSIDLRNKGITHVDDISPFVCSEIQSLDLSNNKLISIAKLAQFSELTELDISSNKIADCQELECLRNMVKLKKVYFSNNPFLSEPIEENLLELILEKETDIEILSLELIKEVENEEIKIIFLKNYLSKIELHEELKRKANVSSNSNKLKGEQLIQKIIPQFYTAIESPKLLSSIKKEALTIKKQNRDSLEDALAKTKEMKQGEIDRLLKSIVSVLQHSNLFIEQKTFTLEVNFNENTITFSPERKGRKDFNNTVRIDEQDEYSPVRCIELSKVQNTLEEITMTNLRPKQIEQSPHLGPKQQQPLTNNLDALQTARKDNTGLTKTHGRFKSFAEFKETLQRKKKASKQNRDSKISPCKAEQRSMKRAFATPVVEKATTSPKAEYIRVEDGNQSSTNRGNRNIVVHASSGVSPTNMNESTVSWRNLYQSVEQLTPQNIQVIYYKTMTKVHPTLNLLHSPVSSLNDQQKNTLLDILKSHHKDIFTELIKQRVNHQATIRQKQHSKLQIANILAESQRNYRKSIEVKQEYQWIDNRYKCLQSDYTQLLSKCKQLENAEKLKTTMIANTETSYKKIKTCYTEKIEELLRLQKCEENEEIISQRAEQRIKKKYLKIINQKGAVWKNVLSRQKIIQHQRNLQLYLWGMQSFKVNWSLERSMKRQIQRYHQKLVQQQFNQWKYEIIFEKKSRKCEQLIKRKQKSQLIDLLRKNIPVSRMAKLAKIQAQRSFSERSCRKHLSAWKNLYSRRKHLGREADNLWVARTCSKHLLAIKTLIEWRKIQVNDLSQRLQTSKVHRQFRKLAYLMKKELIEYREAQNRVRVYREHCTRVAGFGKIKQTVDRMKALKLKTQNAVRFVASRYIKQLQSYKRRTSKMMRKLRNYCYWLRYGIIKRSLIREKMSFAFSDRLLTNNMTVFISNLVENRGKRSSLRQSNQRLLQLKSKLLKFLKLKLMKGLYVMRLKGRNYVKNRALQEMNFQMDVNDQRALQLIKLGQSSISKCEEEILFLKSQIQTQSNRQLALLAENQSLMLTFNESCEIMKELRKEVDRIKEESLSQQIKYNKLAKKYNQAVSILQKRVNRQRLSQITEKEEP